MAFSPSICSALLCLLPLTNKAFAQTSTSSTSLPQATTIHQFPDGTYIENFAIRQDGSLLIDTLSAPQTLYFDPSKPDQQPIVIANYPPPATGALGLAELGSDVFYVATNAYDFQAGAPPANGTGQIWRLDFSECNGNVEDAALTLVANITDSLLLDGLAAVPESNMILVTDALAGVIFGVDVETGEVTVAINDTLTSITPRQPDAIADGPDGLAILGNYVYWTNDAQQLFARAPIDENGVATGAAETLVSGPSIPDPDDLAFTGAGNAAYIADGKLNAVQYFDGTGKISPIVGIESPTSVRIAKDGKSILICNTGNTSAYADPPVLVGGSIATFAI